MNRLLRGCLVAATLALSNVSAHAGKDGDPVFPRTA